MGCSDFEMQIKVFSAIKLIEAGVSTGKVSSMNWADKWVAYSGRGSPDKHGKNF